MPRPKAKPKHSVHVRMDYETFTIIQQYAEEHNRSMSWVINNVLDRAAKAMKAVA